MSDIFKTLITNRQSGETYYNISDLNRVEEAVKQLAQRMTNEGYYVTPKAKTPTVLPEIENPEAPDVKPDEPAISVIKEPWIESSGTQYIDTGFKPNQNTRVVIDFQGTTQKDIVYLFGARVSDSDRNYSFFWYVNRWDAHYSNASNIMSFTNAKFTTRLLVDYNKNSCTVNGTTVTKTATTFQCPYTMYIFSGSGSGAATAPISGKLYSCQIYDNDALVRDFIPALDDNNVACLYDKVEGKYYYNKGSGSFTYGENVYTPVEYIESSTGTQYIDTGIKGKTGISAKGEFSVANFTSAIPLGCYNPQRCYMLSFDGTYVRYGYVNWHNATKPITANEKHSFEVDFSAGNQFLKIDDEILITSKETTTFANNYNLYAFAYNDSGTAGDYAKIKIYALSLYDNDVLVRDYIPVTDSSGVALLYDRLNGIPYYNAGSGTFNAGAPIVEEETPDNEEDEEVLPDFTYDVDPYIWNVYDIPTDKETARYLSNLFLIRRQIAQKQLNLPNDMEGFNYVDANNIEILLFVVDNLVEQMIAQYRRCNTFRCGERR